MITVGITNYNYGRYLGRAIESAQGADEISVVDDHSDDDSLSVIDKYGVHAIYHAENSGSAVRGYNELIETAKSDRLILLSADDYLLPGAIEKFRATEGDWVFGDVVVVDDKDEAIDSWAYVGWPTEPVQALARGLRDLSLPVTMLACFNLDWIRRNGLTFENFENTTTAADTRTGIEWLTHWPSIRRIPEPLFAYRRHAGQETDTLNAEREVMQADLVALYLRLFDTQTLNLFQDI